MRDSLIAAAFAGLSIATAANAQIVAQTPPPSQAAPVPETAAEANAAAVPGPPVTHVERSASPDLPDTIVTTYPGNLAPPPPAAFNKDYPPCTAEVQDNCRNRGEDDEPDSEERQQEAARPPRG